MSVNTGGEVAGVTGQHTRSLTYNFIKLKLLMSSF